MVNVSSALPANTYDAIVVGSGISGGWAAKELTEKGLKVLLLERGRNVQHVTDYKNALKAPWELEHRGRNSTKVKADHPILNHSFLSEPGADFFDEIGVVG